MQRYSRNRYSEAEWNIYGHHIATSPIINGKFAVSVSLLMNKLPDRSRSAIQTHLGRMAVHGNNAVWAGDAKKGIPHDRIKKSQDVLLNHDVEVRNLNKPVFVIAGGKRKKKGTGNGDSDYDVEIVLFNAPTPPPVVIPKIGNIYGRIQQVAMDMMVDKYNEHRAGDNLPPVNKPDFIKYSMGVVGPNPAEYVYHAHWSKANGFCTF